MGHLARIPDFCMAFGDSVEQSQSLVVRNWRLTLDNVGQLAELTDLRELRIKSRALDLDAVNQVTRIPSLELIAFASPALLDCHVQAFSNEMRVSVLGLSSEGITDACIPYLLHLRLHSLGLPGTSVSNVGVRTLATSENCRYLKCLDLSGTRINDESMAELHRFGSLRELAIRDTRTTDRGVEWIPNQFASLDLSGTGIEGKNASLFLHLTRLESLNLNRTTVRSDVVAACLSLPNLIELDVSNTKVDDGLANEVASSSIRSIRVRGTNMTSSGVQMLRKNNPAVTVSMS